MSFVNSKILSFAAATLSVAVATAAPAAVVNPVSYSMQNGDGQAHGGSFNYWDGSYNGSGATTTDGLSGSYLSGGLGDLTDGVIATQNWYATENGAGTGPYVGWLNTNPTIDFFFSVLTNFTSVTFFFDDSEGAGGVSQPGSVSVNGANSAVPNNPGGDPFAYTIDLTGLMANHLTIDIFASNQWVFLSEVQFTGAPASVPLPAGGLLLLGALGGLAALRRRAKTPA